MQTHLEPLENPVAVMSAGERSDAELEGSLSRFVERRTGRPPRALRLLHTAGGLVVFLTIGLRSGATLSDAHKLASELEEGLRGQYPFIADIVVHTEP